MSWSKDLSASLVGTSVQAKICGHFDTSFVLLLAFTLLFPFSQTMTSPVIKIQLFVQKWHNLVLLQRSTHCTQWKSGFGVYSTESPQLWSKHLKPFLVYTLSELLCAFILQSYLYKLIFFKFTGSLYSNCACSDMCKTPKKEIGLARWHRGYNWCIMDLHNTGPERICILTDVAQARKKKWT